LNDVVVILLAGSNLVQVVGNVDHRQGIQVHLSEHFLFEGSSGILALGAIDTKSESEGVQDGVDGVELGLSDGGENGTESTEGSSDRSEERSDKLGDDDGSEHGDEQGEELGDPAKVEVGSSNSILNSVVGGGGVVCGGIVCGGVICGGGIVILGGAIGILGGAIGGWSVIGGGGIVIRGGAIAGGGGGIPRVGGGSIASSGWGGCSVFSVVMTSAISEDGSDEGEGSDVSGHGDLL